MAEEFAFLTSFPGDTDAADLGLHFEYYWFNEYPFLFNQPNPLLCLVFQSEASLMQVL